MNITARYHPPGKPTRMGHIVGASPAGLGRMADSDWDCNGYDEIEFEVLDRRGYPAPWLAKKLSPEAVARIEGEILESRP